jgi:inner membrane protein
MDNLTHSLTGLALARSGLKRFCPHGTLLLIVAANIPDIDMVSLIYGPLRNLEIHRGYTHSLLMLPVMAAVAVAITSILGREKLPWLRAWLIACVGVVSHLLMDTSMSYGVRLLLPFSSQWFFLDVFSLTDWVVLAVLLLAWLGPGLARLVGDEIGDRRPAGRGIAIFALSFFAAYGCFRGLMHQRAVAQLESRIYDEVLESPAKRMDAFPNSANPLIWSGIVEGEHAYRLYDVPSYGEFDPGGGDLVYKPWSKPIRVAASSAPFRYALYFARFPLWNEQPAAGLNGGVDVTLTDIRFGRPGESFFTISATVDATGQVQNIHWGRAN